MNNVDGMYYRTESGADYEILRKRVSIAQLVKDSAFSNVVTMLDLKYGVYQEISLQHLFLEDTNASRELKRTWIRWLCENGYIKEGKKEDEISIGDFVKLKDMHVYIKSPISTGDYGIVKKKEKGCKGTIYYNVQLLDHPTLTFLYSREGLEKQDSNLFEKVFLFRMDEKGSIVPDHCVYRKRK
jgi:hypothetical protein